MSEPILHTDAGWFSGVSSSKKKAASDEGAKKKGAATVAKPQGMMKSAKQAAANVQEVTGHLKDVTGNVANMTSTLADRLEKMSRDITDWDVYNPKKGSGNEDVEGFKHMLSLDKQALAQVSAILEGHKVGRAEDFKNKFGDEHYTVARRQMVYEAYAKAVDSVKDFSARFSEVSNILARMMHDVETEKSAQQLKKDESLLSNALGWLSGGFGGLLPTGSECFDETSASMQQMTAPQRCACCNRLIVTGLQ